MQQGPFALLQHTTMADRQNSLHSAAAVRQVSKAKSLGGKLARTALELREVYIVCLSPLSFSKKANVI